MKLKKMAAGLMALFLGVTSVPAADVSAAETDGSGTDNKIENDIFWHDTDGNPIYSQGGGIFKFETDGEEKYYWYGVHYQEAEEYYENPLSSKSNNHFVSVTCYSSTDLVNWNFEGDVVTREQLSGTEEMGGEEVQWVGRLGVAYMEESGTYAMFVQHEYADPDNSIDAAGGDTSEDGTTKQVLVLTSDSPVGEFTWNQRINMAEYTGGTSNTGDQTVFTDEDTGKDYLVYSYGRGRGRIFISEIEEQGDGKIGLGEAYKVYQGTGREGNCMFKYNGKYYICASDLYGWNASHAYYLVLDSLEPEYLKSKDVVTNMEVMPGCSDDFCHVTQTGFFYTVRGTEQETVIFCGDRWADFAGNGLGYNQWCPLSFEGDTPYFNSLSSWNLDEETGTWNVAEDNNYAMNGSFDADRVSSSSLAGWTNTVEKGNSPINNTGTRTTGKYALALSDSVDFDCTVSQEIASTDYVDLPDGDYDLKAMVRSSGDFDTLWMYVRNGGITTAYPLDNGYSEWTEVTLANVPVSGGSAEIGFTADGSAGAYCYIDDVRFVRSDAESQNGAISGTITTDVTGRNASVTAVSEDGSRVYTAEIQLDEEENSYVLDTVKPGTYTVSVTAGGSASQEGSREVTVKAGETALNTDFNMKNASGSISGIVTDKLSGEALSGVTVKALKDGNSVAETVTGEDGSFVFETLEEGTYALSFAKTGYQTIENVTVEVRTGENTQADTQSMELTSGTATGLVTDEDGNPVSGAEISFRGCSAKDDTYRYEGKTDENGSFTITDIQEGIYQVIALSGDSVGAVKQNVEIETGKSSTVNLVMPAEEVEVVNGDFEAAYSSKYDIEGWTNEYEVSDSYGSYVTARNGEYYAGRQALSYYSGKAYKGHVYQTVTGLKRGTYYLNVMVQAGVNSSDEFYLYAKDSQGNLLAAENIPTTVNSAWEMIGLEIKVPEDNSQITIGFMGESLAAGTWAHMDNVRIGYTAETEEPDQPLRITADPQDAEGAAGENAVFTVEAEGSGLSYQWQYANAGSSVWRASSLSGNDTPEITVPIASYRDGQKYRCVVTDKDGNSVTSGSAAVKMIIPDGTPVITSQPEDFTGISGETAVFRVEAEGTGLTYQWQYCNEGSNVWRNSSMAGNATSAISVEIASYRDGQKYRCVVTGEEGYSATSEAASIIVGPGEGAPVITEQPASCEGTVGETAVFEVKASGTNLTYQWQYCNANSSVWRASSMEGSTTARVSVPVTAGRDGQKYRCVITSGNGRTAITETAVMTVQK